MNIKNNLGNKKQILSGSNVNCVMNPYNVHLYGHISAMGFPSSSVLLVLRPAQ